QRRRHRLAALPVADEHAVLAAREILDAAGGCGVGNAVRLAAAHPVVELVAGLGHALDEAHGRRRYRCSANHSVESSATRHLAVHRADLRRSTYGETVRLLNQIHGRGTERIREECPEVDVVEV